MYDMSMLGNEPDASTSTAQKLVGSGEHKSFKGGKLQERLQRRKTSHYTVVDGVKHTSVKPKTVF